MKETPCVMCPNGIAILLLERDGKRTYKCNRCGSYFALEGKRDKND